MRTCTTHRSKVLELGEHRSSIGRNETHLHDETHNAFGTFGPIVGAADSHKLHCDYSAQQELG